MGKTNTKLHRQISPQIRCGKTKLIHPLALAENQDFAQGLLVYLCEVDRILNLGQVGPCDTLNQYGYGGNLILLTKGVEVLESAVGAIFVPTRFSFP